MATLPTLVPTNDVQVGTWTTDASGTTNLWQKIEETVAAATDANDFVMAPTGTSNTTANQYEVGFTNTPSDFINMSTLSINVRYNQTGRSDDTLALVVRIESSAGVAYTNDVTIANITTTTFTNSGATAMTLTTAGTNATKTDWDSAYIALSQTYTVSMAADNARAQVSAIELTGTYASGATVTTTTISPPVVSMPAPTVKFGQTATPVTILASTILLDPTELVVEKIDTPTLGYDAMGTFPIANQIDTRVTVTASVINAVTTIPAPTAKAGATVTTVTFSALTTINSPTVTVAAVPQPATISGIITLPSVTAMSYLFASWGINAGLVQVINETVTSTTVASTVTLPSTTQAVTETRYATSNIANNGCTTPANANGANDGVFTANTGGSTWDARWAIGDPSNALSGTQNGTIYWKKDATAGNDPTATVELWENGTLVSALISALTITDAISSSNFNFAASSITNRNNVEIRVAVTASGGTVSARRTVQVDAIGITFAQVA